LDANGRANHILTKKLNRLLAFRDSVCNFCLEIIHQMYWVDFKRYKKTNLSLTDCANFAVNLCKDLSDKFIARLDQEYNIAKVIQEEFSKTGKY